MKYEAWISVEGKNIRKYAEKFNKWAKRAKYQLLTNYGPRIAKLSQSFYYDCGGQYGLEQQFGNLIVKLSIPWKPSANKCEMVESQETSALLCEVEYEELQRSIRNAEKSAKNKKII